MTLNHRPLIWPLDHDFPDHLCGHEIYHLTLSAACSPARLSEAEYPDAAVCQCSFEIGTVFRSFHSHSNFLCLHYLFLQADDCLRKRPMLGLFVVLNGSK